MSLFYKMLLGMVIIGAAVITYDLFQVEIEMGGAVPRIRFGPQTGRFTFRKPQVEVRIVYASMFGPGEPVMRVRDLCIYRFEEEYSDVLAVRQGRSVAEKQKGPFVAKTLRRVGRMLPAARRRLKAIAREDNPGKKRQKIDQLEAWLVGREIFLMPLDARAGHDAKLQALTRMVEALAALVKDPASAVEKVDVRLRLVYVERRWQGRWVLSANRPRFLTGREVPDIMVGSKMELLALVQDDYAVAMNEPLEQGGVSPMDGPDTYGDPSRRWRDSFIPSMLKEGIYDFLVDQKPQVEGKVFMVPSICTTFPIFYNEMNFKKAGVERPPRTWDELIEVCRKLEAAGISPLTADAEVYCDMWQTWLVFRALGPEAWETTITGAPRWKTTATGERVRVPVHQRRSHPPWTDPRYQKVHTAIRDLRQYFTKGFRGYKWPSAQRDFAKGDAAMMICGSWLFQELGGYKDIASEKVFKLNCFNFPTWPAEENLSTEEKAAHDLRQRAIWAGVSGLMVCRQGKATRHAVELVKYLSAKDHPYLVHWNGLIACQKDADFPPSLAAIEKQFKTAPVVYSRAPNIYARRFGSQTMSPMYQDFFLKQKGQAGFLEVDRFLATLAEKTAEYLTGGGEEGYE